MTEEMITEDEMKKSLLLFSGGLDTTVILYNLVQEEIPVRCLCFDYGQQATTEIKYAIKTCEKLNIKCDVMDIRKLKISGELGHGGNIQNETDIIIPNRNSIFLSIATNYAITHGCEVIYIGSKIGSEACFDEKYEFIEQYNELNKVSDIKYIPIKAPLIFYDSGDVMDLALKMNVPLKETWSCFGNKSEKCGECKNCKALPPIIDMKIAEYTQQLNNLKEYKETFNNTD